MSESPASPPFVRIGPERLTSPVILSVPHAGRDYSPELLKAARLSKPMLETLEDRLVDRLVWQATAAGVTTFVARAPRAEIDLNRDEREIDPVLVAPLSRRSSVGAHPRRMVEPVAGHRRRAIWPQRITQSELPRRAWTAIHRPYTRRSTRAAEGGTGRRRAVLDALDLRARRSRRKQVRGVRRPPRHTRPGACRSRLAADAGWATGQP